MGRFITHDNVRALNYLEKGKYARLARNLFKYEGLQADVAVKLIENDFSEEVFSNFTVFNLRIHKDIAERLIEDGDDELVLRNLENFMIQTVKTLLSK